MTQTLSHPRIHVIDSHTAGEPTRLVVDGGPDLGDGPLSARLQRLRTEYDWFRSAVVNEPRGSDVLVGALLCEPVNPACSAGVIFFNNVGYLGMCGHGMIGLIVTLAYMGRIEPGRHQVETPVGIVAATLHPAGNVTVENVPSYRYAANIPVDVPGHGTIHGDVAWGGNWFFLAEETRLPLRLDYVDALTAYTWKVRETLAAQGITGANGQEIDHIELFSPSDPHQADSRNFVLCPGKAYDRSPCGTGTSAKLACLHADGKLRRGELWRQQGILGTVFEARFEPLRNTSAAAIAPSITGSAFVTSEANLILNPRDPFCMGIAR
jgi:4-hydroxyproline epimerase